MTTGGDESIAAFWQSVPERESALLAPYAMHSRQSAGRKHPEPDHPYRGPFQRDRDRIVHSAAYRRLSFKTQVFTGDFGDYHRTRLTHTLEVASVARTIGRALALNEDLIEALALLHDIGHPPFGHSGEDVLDECLRDQGGFSHNQQALRIVEELETRYHDFPGLNLSAEVLEGQARRVLKERAADRPLLEVQVVEAADSISYDTHDADDAARARLAVARRIARDPALGVGPPPRPAAICGAHRRRTAPRSLARTDRLAGRRLARLRGQATGRRRNRLAAKRSRRRRRSSSPIRNWPSRRSSWSVSCTSASIDIRGCSATVRPPKGYFARCSIRSSRPPICCPRELSGGLPRTAYGGPLATIWPE